jgi:hypothetical protein
MDTVSSCKQLPIVEGGMKCASVATGCASSNSSFLSKLSTRIMYA